VVVVVVPDVPVVFGHMRHDTDGILLEMMTGDRRLLSPAGVSDDAAVSSGLEKR
jgi:hypothetical protein